MQVVYTGEMISRNRKEAVEGFGRKRHTHLPLRITKAQIVVGTSKKGAWSLPEISS